MARGNDPLDLKSLMDKRQDSSMSATIDSYIAHLQQAGFVPNAAPTSSKRDIRRPDVLLPEKRDTPSVPLVLALLGDHGFVPSPSTNSKRDATDTLLHHHHLDNNDDDDSPLTKRTLPDINLVVSRLAAHGFVPTGGNNNNTGSLTKRDATSDINTVIAELEALGFNPDDFTSSSTADSTADSLSATTGVTCPQDDHKSLATTNNAKYEVLCGAGYDGYDLTNTHADSLAACLSACDAYVPQGSLASLGPCKGATWIASWADANCFFKWNATSAGQDGRCVSGRKVA